jgi:hypothetical protein
LDTILPASAVGLWTAVMQRHEHRRGIPDYASLALAVVACACRAAAPDTDEAARAGGERYVIPRPEPIQPTFTTDTLQARRIVLVDQHGRARMTLSGGEPFTAQDGPRNGGPTIIFNDVNDDDDAALMILEAGRSESRSDGEPYALIHAEAGDYGMFKLVAEPNGAHLWLGSDDTDAFEITCGKEGVVVAVEPKESRGSTVSAGPPSEEGPRDRRARGVKIAVEQGRIIVRDLDGHELGAVPTSDAPANPAPR